MRDQTPSELAGLDALASERWENPAHQRRLGAALAQARTSPSRRAPRRALAAGVALTLAAGAGVAGASALPGIRGLFERGPDGETEMVITDQDGKELHRRREGGAGLVISVDDVPAGGPKSLREERRGR